MNYFYKTPIDYLVITLDEEGLVLAASLEKNIGQSREIHGGIKKELDDYFIYKKDLSMKYVSKEIAGTSYQKKVWGAIAKIPFGKTATYKELAIKLGDENGARSLGTACGKNPLALFIPCQRVVRTSGEDFGYSWGKDRKKWLLEFEKGK